VFFVNSVAKAVAFAVAVTKILPLPFSVFFVNSVAKAVAVIRSS
jgi:hypothetical protein